MVTKYYGECKITDEHEIDFQTTSNAEMMRSRLDKIIKRNMVQETESHDKGNVTNG